VTGANSPIVIASGEARIIESGKFDRFGRTLATLTVNGTDVAKTLIAERLARPYHGERRTGGATTPVDKP
jgi:endonuclease YncB( thermonuclease family)